MGKFVKWLGSWLNSETSRLEFYIVLVLLVGYFIFTFLRLETTLSELDVLLIAVEDIGYK